MSKTITNMIQYPILQEIERILELCPHHPHQQAFAHPDRHQQLVAWVLNRVPNVFIATEEGDEAAIHPNYAPYCSDQRSCLEYVVREGIQEILVQNQAEIEHDIPDEEISEEGASHWFG